MIRVAAVGCLLGDGHHAMAGVGVFAILSLQGDERDVARLLGVGDLVELAVFFNCLPGHRADVGWIAAVEGCHNVVRVALWRDIICLLGYENYYKWEKQSCGI